MSKKREKLHDKIAAILQEYLEEYGWKVVVLNTGARISNRGSKYNFTIEFDFTGGKKEKNNE